jgi:hypothetical protein
LAWEVINRAAASGVRRQREERDIGRSLANGKKEKAEDGKGFDTL